jgi:hypothetical protein
MKIGSAASLKSNMNIANTATSALSGVMAGSTAQPKASAADVKGKFNQVLNQTMVGTVLKEARASASKSTLFNGGRGEEIFGAQLDQVFADKIGARMSTPVGGAALSHLSSLARR